VFFFFFLVSMLALNSIAIGYTHAGIPMPQLGDRPLMPIPETPSQIVRKIINPNHY